ncbi:Coenzyme F420-dependent N5N10-methylene tetrahydromethanopterin reductase and related flavin-dependent oxidoreductase [Rubrobacter radiotolerans]|uniref:Coenzyme F420-dependent N5N10-methylene tetrahydromethanopterin reductase and related flavin-dependent oxidoreductase n=1 Tax=Rubrobacter radiotolerans TaxID=42256 RepID=A0A023X126_RUBRA|nr:LLM class flavin-dependent oxidoreductase [Rubrobacter radiotolerans]AHY45715.1 Coenzyme F420-dependent N5N10-methylene tetrahydromethanopterin reductase and related flavin-dependent oxidoreductase [Rubrobacter radiotolerans]MDX5893131.1 LLM class flavin-dependent oxidoreductase [Rubrobacter radiotolerans]SMC03112.1 Flavin-dependent oxidoreductase, luciferase family (includes alkanesulfonate monooxygenase SsuD and methylene tetrahydromethanopterin reductase) [Rubrobacter radiotolerans DSM 586
MKYGFIVTSGDPRTVCDLAREAEGAGWDGVFYWDGMYLGSEHEVYDPWVVLAGMAMSTQRARLGAVLTPPTRRRPWKLARETVTLDHLSNGRLVLPVGLGAVETFGSVGEETDRRTRAERLDESLAILDGLWSGEAFSFSGKHFELGEMTFRPPPVQRPRIPVWPVGAWPSRKSVDRALRYDGMLAYTTRGEVLPQDVRAMRDYADRKRPGEPFDLIVEGETPGDDPERAAAAVRPFREAGATWWIESPWTPPNDPDALRKRIRQGPPKPSASP